MLEQKEFNGKKPVKKAITKEELNDLIFDMIGLSLTSDGVVIDDDLNVIISIKGKYMVTDEQLLNENIPNIILYDPVGNPSIMDKLFKHYLNKYMSENGTEVKSISSINSTILGKSYLEVVQADGIIYKSASYYNDNIKCADILLQLNCDTPAFDLHQLDNELYIAIQKLIEEKKHGKRGGRKKKVEEKPQAPIEYQSVTDWLDEANAQKNE